MVGRVVIALGMSLVVLTPVFAGTKSAGVDKRQRHQEQRIQHGLKSGALTRDEARKLRAEQRAIRQKERAMKSDGTFTKEERKEIRQDLKEANRNIRDEKHDAETR